MTSTAIAQQLANPKPTLKEALDVLLAELQDRVASGVRSAHTLSMNESHVSYILERIPGDTPVDQVDAGVIDQLVAAERAGRRLRADGKAKQLHPSTIKKRLSTLHRALKIQRRLGNIERLPEFPELPTAYKPDMKFIATYREAIAIYYALPIERARWFWLALWTGQHSSDVERMTKEDLQPVGPDKWMRVRNTKNRRTDGIRIACPDALARFFFGHWHNTGAGERLVEPWPHVSSQLPDVCERLGFPRYTAKSLRHTFFTWMISRVGITKAVMEIGGWTTYEMVCKVYGHALAPQFRDAVEALDGFVETAARRRGAKKSPEKRMPPPAPARADGGGTTDPATERTRTVGNVGEPKKLGEPVGAERIDQVGHHRRRHGHGRRSTGPEPSTGSPVPSDRSLQHLQLRNYRRPSPRRG